MSTKKYGVRGQRLSWAVVSMFAVVGVSGCDSGSAGTALPGAAAPGNGASTSTGPGAVTGSTSSGTGTVSATCLSSDPNKLCLGVHFVAYKDSSGTPVATVAQAKTIASTMNQLWSQCNIGFQIENYEQVDPTTSGLSYGAASQNELDQIRSTYASPSNELLAVTTGPWGTAVNAWTNMPGSAVYGAVLEASIVDYGGGIIYAHEFGHYLGLDHVADPANLMNAIIATTSTSLDSSQCQTARDTANSYWSAMLRK